MDLQTTKIEWLAGIKVLLLGHYVPAPFAAYLLANLGATVIKVEDGHGDHLRQIGRLDEPSAGQTSPMFHVLNAGFQSIGLQYRQAAGAAILQQLMAQVDVVLDGNRVGALERYLGVPVAVAAPQAIYVPISAYGQVGPMAMLAGHDNNILALGGNLSYTQSDADGLPTVFSAPLADLFAGQMAAMGALAALVGRGQRTAPMPTMIDASMLHAGFFLNVLQLSARNGLDYQPPQPSAEWMNGGRADYRPYRCSDGKCIFFGLIEAWAAKRFFKALGRADLGDMLAHTDRLRTALEALFAQRTQAEWVALGTELDACITAVNDLETAAHHPQVQSLGRMQTVEARDIGDMEVPSFPLGFGPQSLPIQAQPDAPLLGEHNHTILQNLLGMPQTTIDGLLEDGILIQAPRKTAQP